MPPKHDTLIHVNDTTVTTLANPIAVNSGFPTGNNLITELLLRISGMFYTSSAAGSAVVDGALKIMRSIWFKTDKHGYLIKGVRGILLNRVLQLSHETRGSVTDCASNASGTTFDACLRIPFADQDRMLRPYDAALDMINSIADLKVQPGLVTDVQSAGTAAAVSSLRLDTDVEVLNEPYIGDGGLGGPGNELPKYVPIWEELAPVAAAAGSVTIPIPTGDRLVRRIHLAQVTIDPTTGLLTEVSSIIPGTSKLTYKIGTDLKVDGISYTSLNEKNKQDARVESMPAGMCFIGFDRQKSDKRLLDLYEYPAGIASNIYIDAINTVSNGWIIPVMEYFQHIPDQARRKA